MRRWHYHKAAKLLQTGGVVAYPTEAVFGLGCDPTNTQALQRLLKLKQRPRHKGLIVLADSISCIERFIEPRFFREHEATFTELWPGAITLICTASQYASPLLTGDRGSIALRVTHHPIASRLIAAFKHPIVSTSANLSHKAPATTTWNVRKQFGKQLDYIVPGVVGTLSRPTPILDLANGQWVRR